MFFFENTAKIQNIFSFSLRISSIFGKYGCFTWLYIIFFAASEIKVKEINALCKQTSACGDSLSSSPQADVLFYMLGVYSIFTGRSFMDCPWRRISCGDTNLVICLVFAS